MGHGKRTASQSERPAPLTTGKRPRAESAHRNTDKKPRKINKNSALSVGEESRRDAPVIKSDAAARVAKMSIDDFMDGGFLDLIDMRGRTPQLGGPVGLPSTSKIPSAGPTSESGGGKRKTAKANNGATKVRTPASGPANSGKLVKPGRGAEDKLVGRDIAANPGTGAATRPHSREHKEGGAGRDGPDNGEEGRGDGKARSNDRGKSRKSEAAAHAADLEALKQRDPEFFAYLQEADQELLAFGAGRGEEEEEEEEQTSGDARDVDDGNEVSTEDEDEDVAQGGDEPEDEDEADHEEDADASNERISGGRAAPSRASDSEGIISEQLVRRWCQDARANASLRAMHNVLKAYRMACHFGEEEDAVEGQLRQVSQSAFNSVLLFVLKEADGLFWRMLGVEEGQRAQAGNLARLPRWRKVAPLLKSYLGNTLHLLDSLKEKRMLLYVMRRLRPSVPLMYCSERIQRKTLKAALGFFSNGPSAGVRLQAFLLIQAMARTLPPPALPTALKGVYRAYVSNARMMTGEGAATLGLMSRCCVELYGLDTGAAYEHAFTYIRQLAVLLRGALAAKTKDAFREVYCWQTINSLDLWTKIVAAYPDRREMRELGLPLSQILSGVIRLVGSPRYIPLRLRCARMLVSLGRALHLRTHLTPLVMDMLQWKGLYHAPRGGRGAQPESPYLLRASKAALLTPAFQQDVVDQVMEILAEHLAQAARNVGFPEMAHCTMLSLRDFAKRTPVERFRAAARGLVAAVEANNAWLGMARTSVDFAPKDSLKVGDWDPSAVVGGTAPLESHAEALATAGRQKRSMAAARQVDMGKKGRAAHDDDDDDNDDEDNSSEDDEEEEDSGDEDTDRVIRQPAKTQKRDPGIAAKLVSTAAWDEDDTLEDTVGDYHLSDEEEM